MNRAYPSLSGLAILMMLLAGAELAIAQSTHQFPQPLSPGEAIKAATQAAAVLRKETGGVEVLSDTQGWDYAHYVQRVVEEVRINWEHRMPESVMMGKKGKLAIEFAIKRDGSIRGMLLDQPGSRDVALDLAAWGSITASSPFPPLPDEFKGEYLALRFRFYYNPDKADLTEPATKHAALIQQLADSNPPKYPRNALDAKIEGLVRLEGTVEANGEIKNLKSIEGDKDLAQAAIGAVSTWRFHPAERNGKHIDEPVHINVVFHLDGERVRTQVFNLAGELK